MIEDERFTEIVKELDTFCRDCKIDPNTEYIHRDFLLIVASHFVKWQKEQMMKGAVDFNHLFDWYIHSVSDKDIPIWTSAHIEELLKDYIVIPK